MDSIVQPHVGIAYGLYDRFRLGKRLLNGWFQVQHLGMLQDVSETFPGEPYGSTTVVSNDTRR